MTLLNTALGTVFDVLLAPFRGLPAIAGLAALSAATAVGMLLVFRATSDQAGIAAVKRRIHACLFEIRLFNDDFRAILRAQLEILRHNLTYLRLSLVPVLWMIVPLVLAVAHLHFRYGYAPLEPGETTLLEVELAEGWREAGIAIGEEGKPQVRLQVPPGLRAETPAVWVPAARELTWRLGAERPGEYRVALAVGDEVVEKAVRVGGSLVPRSPVRPRPGFWSQLLYPAEPPLPRASPVREIRVAYGGGEVPVLGWRLHWMVVYFVLAILLAFLLRKPFRVEI